MKRESESLKATRTYFRRQRAEFTRGAIRHLWDFVTNIQERRQSSYAVKAAAAKSARLELENLAAYFRPRSTIIHALEEWMMVAGVLSLVQIVVFRDALDWRPFFATTFVVFVLPSLQRAAVLLLTPPNPRQND